MDKQSEDQGVKMWIATIDFMKAFDSINHNSIWNAIKTCRIEKEYISLLKRLYKDQKATVLTDKESDMFEMKRKTKQGDPLCSLLFNGIERRPSTLAKEKRTGHMLGRPRAGLPHKFTVC